MKTDQEGRIAQTIVCQISMVKEKTLLPHTAIIIHQITMEGKTERGDITHDKRGKKMAHACIGTGDFVDLMTQNVEFCI